MSSDSVTFRGVEVRRSEILKAVATFDAEFARPNDYLGWLDKAGYKYALRYRRRLYPPKWVLSRATGLHVRTFNGGIKHANRVLTELGFQVIDKPGSDGPGTTRLKPRVVPGKTRATTRRLVESRRLRRRTRASYESEFETPARRRTLIERERALVDRYQSWLGEQNLDSDPYRLVFDAGADSLYLDLFVHANAELIEAKGTSKRMAIRTAIGEVLDYEYWVNQTESGLPRVRRRTILLPEPTTTDMIQLLNGLAIQLVYEDKDGSFVRQAE